MSKIITYTSVALLISLSVEANAQSGFPDGFDASISGIRIGQPIADARASIEKLFPLNIEDVPKAEDLVAAGEPVRRGAVLTEATAQHPLYDEPFSISIGASDAVESVDRSFRKVYSYNGDSASVLLSSPLNEQRVEAIYRAISYKDSPLNFQAFVEKVNSTYGKAHFVGSNERYMAWGFKDGANIGPARSGPAFVQYQKCTTISKSPRHAAVNSDFMLSPPNKLSLYFNGRGESYPSHEVCDAGILLEYNRNQNGLVENAFFTFVDMKMMIDDRNAFIAHISKLEEEAEAAQKAAAPTGSTAVDDF